MSQAGIIQLTGLGPTVVETLTGNTGGAVPPTGNNIYVVGDGTTCTVAGNPGTSTLTISVINDSFTWSEKATTFSAVSQNGYFCTAALTVNLPATGGIVTGSSVIIYVDTASAVIIKANTGQQIEVSTNLSSVAGTATSTAQGNILTLVFRTSDTTWHAISSQGTFTLA